MSAITTTRKKALDGMSFAVILDELRGFWPSLEEKVYLLTRVKVEQLWRGQYESWLDFLAKEVPLSERHVRRLTAVISMTPDESNLTHVSTTQVSSDANDNYNAHGKMSSGRSLMAIGDSPIPAARKMEVEVDNEVLDGTGFPIPDPARSTWNRQPEFSEYYELMSKIRAWLNKAMRAEDRLWTQGNLASAMELASRLCACIDMATPYAVCTQCKGLIPMGCPQCRGLGMISKSNWRFVPVELRDARLNRIKKLSK